MDKATKSGIVNSFNSLSAILLMTLGLLGPRREAELGLVDYMGSAKAVYIYPSRLTKDGILRMLIFREKLKFKTGK